MNVVKPFVFDVIRSQGLEVSSGRANFLLVKPRNCAAAVDYLRDAGILVRSMSAPALRGTFRVSMGTMDEMENFVDVLKSYMKVERR